MNVLLAATGALTAFLLNFLKTPIILRFAHKKKLFDSKDHRKLHDGNIPRLGGIGFFLSFCLTTGVLFLYSLFFNKELYSGLNIYFYLSLIIIFLTGLVDDLKTVTARFKLVSQLVISVLICIGGYTIKEIPVPFIDYTIQTGVWAYPLTTLWIIGITNAINLLDGMDGQAGGVSAIASFTLGIIALFNNQMQTALPCFILFGSLCGFLLFNYPPARIFMGDCGSLFLGTILAILPLTVQTQQLNGKFFIVAVTLLLIPILDVFAAMIRRYRKGLSFLIPDRGHIHHKFLDHTQLNSRQILAVIYGLCCLSALCSILFVQHDSVISQMILLLNLALVLYIFTFLHNKKKQDQKKSDVKPLLQKDKVLSS